MVVNYFFNILCDHFHDHYHNRKATKQINCVFLNNILSHFRFLATGDTYHTIAVSYQMSKSVVSKIVPQTCEILWNVLQSDVMPLPDERKWKRIAEEFEELWQFPHCLGSLDWKNIMIQAPKNSGSLFFNYKKHFSVVLLAVVDANYKFVIVNIGAYGRQSNGSVFSNSLFGRMLKAQQLSIPPPEPLGGSVLPNLPYVFVGDEAFPLLQNLMRPYPSGNLTREKIIFNYRLSRARRTVENAFEILPLVCVVFIVHSC